MGWTVWALGFVGRSYAFGSCACFATAPLTLVEVRAADGATAAPPAWASTASLQLDDDGTPYAVDLAGRRIELSTVQP